MINVGSIHLIDAREDNNLGRSSVALAMFYYCLQVLRLAGPKKMDVSEVECAISSEKKRQKRRRNFGSFYSTKSDDDYGEVDNVVLEYVDCKYKHIPLLLVDAGGEYIKKISLNIPEVYRDFCQEASFGVWIGGIAVDSSLIFEAAMRRVVIVSIGSRSKEDVFVEDWLNYCETGGSAETIPTKFVRWFIFDGEEDRMKSFVDSVNKHSQNMTHVLINTSGYSWDSLDESLYSEAIKKSLVIDFPSYYGGFVREILEDAVYKDESHPAHSFIGDFSAGFEKTGEFDALLEFSKAFKLSKGKTFSEARPTDTY